MLRKQVKKVLLSQLIFIRKIPILQLNYTQIMKTSIMLEEMMP